MVQQNIQSRYTITETVCFLLYAFNNLMEKLNKEPKNMDWNKFFLLYAFVRNLKEKIQIKNLEIPNWLLDRKSFRKLLPLIN